MSETIKTLRENFLFLLVGAVVLVMLIRSIDLDWSAPWTPVVAAVLCVAMGSVVIQFRRFRLLGWLLVVGALGYLFVYYGMPILTAAQVPAGFENTDLGQLVESIFGENRYDLLIPIGLLFLVLVSFLTPTGFAAWVKVGMSIGFVGIALWLLYATTGMQIANPGAITNPAEAFSNNSEEQVAIATTSELIGEYSRIAPADGWSDPIDTRRVGCFLPEAVSGGSFRVQYMDVNGMWRIQPRDEVVRMLAVRYQSSTGMPEEIRILRFAGSCPR